MPTPIDTEPQVDPAPGDEPRSRRAVLAGVGGGAAALVALLTRPARSEAAAGSPLIIGSEANNAGSANTQLRTNSSVVAFKLLQNGPGTALMGYATPATGPTRGVYGRADSPNGDGVQARNAGAHGTGAAVRAFGGNNHGLEASTDSASSYAVRGLTSSSGDAIAIHGAVSSTSPGPGSAAVRGVNNGTGIDGVGVYGSHAGSGVGVYGTSLNGYGVSGNSYTGVAVYGSSTHDYGVHGTSENNYAGYFQDHVLIGGYTDINEIGDPEAPAMTRARLFVRDNGGKTELCVIFNTGGVQVIAAQP